MGPLPGGRAAADAPGFAGIVDACGTLGFAVSFCGGFGVPADPPVLPSGGLDPGREEGVDVRPWSKFGIVFVLAKEGDWTGG